MTIPRCLLLRVLPSIALLSISVLCAADWPHWRGPYRNGTTSESSGWEHGVRFPNRVLWSGEFGEGASAPLVVKGVLYTMGWKDGKDWVRAVDARRGELVWEQSYSCPRYGRHSIGDKGMYKGSTPTPEFDSATGYLYTLSTDGDLNCWNTKRNGVNAWKLNLYEEFQVGQRPQVTERPRSHRDYGYTTAPFFYKDWLIVEVGSTKQGNLIFFDKKTGKTLFGSENRDEAGHTGGLVPISVDGIDCLAVLTARNLVVTRLDEKLAGKTVAVAPWTTDFINNVATPSVIGNQVIVSSKYNITSTALFEISLESGAKEIWQTKDSTGVCSPVVVAGNVYWAHNNLCVLDLSSGKRLVLSGRYGAASSIVATSDNRLFAWANSGDLFHLDTLANTSVDSMVLQQKLRVSDGMAWPHIVLADQRLYVRTVDGNIKCLSLRLEEAEKGVVLSDQSNSPSRRKKKTP